LSLADYVVGTLKASSPDNWWKCVPKELRKKLRLMQEENNAEDPEAFLYLIQFKELIESNWELFKPAFRAVGKKDKKDLGWMGRLNELRNLAAHPVQRAMTGRSFTPDDIAFLRETAALVGRLKEAGPKAPAP
jgi:hypothetical protein